MRDLFTFPARMILVAGAALAVAACGGGDTAAEEANTLDTNIMFEDPANDQSALESVANVTEPAAEDTNVTQPTDNVSSTSPEENDAADTVESNVAGM